MTAVERDCQAEWLFPYPSAFSKAVEAAAVSKETFPAKPSLTRG
jgi:hypothetical protein